MWAICETDLKSIAALDIIATFFFSASSFCFGLVVTILLNFAASASPLTPVASFMLYRGSLFFGAVTLLFAIFGVILAIRKGSILTQIKNETVSSGERSSQSN